MSTHPLRTARSLRNLTIKQLADAAKVGISTVWRAEHNYPINAESRRRLCLYFNMTSQELGLVSQRNETFLAEPVQTPEQEALHALLYASSPSHELISSLGDLFYANDTVHGEPEISFEQQLGAWLVLKGSALASLFDAGLTLDEVLDSLRVILYGFQGVPSLIQSKLLHLHGAATPTRKPTSIEDRQLLDNALHKSVDEGWRLYHTARPAQVLVTGQAQLYLVQQVDDLVSSDVRCDLYAGLYNLIGAGYFLQARYDAAQRMYKRAHRAAAEGQDNWDLAQNLNWQAIVASARGLYTEAIRLIDAALRVIANENDERFMRLKAHLHADKAYNAALLQEDMLVEEGLEASATLLDDLGPDEEFDQTSWYQKKGSCLLSLGNYKKAIDYLQQSLVQLPAPWITRRILTLIPLAEAYARKRERDASIATAEHIAAIIDSADSIMLNHRFLEYQQLLLEIFPYDKHVLSFVTNG